MRPTVRLALLFSCQSSSGSPFAKSSVKLERMTDAGSTRLFRKKQLKACLEGSEVDTPLRTLRAQLAEVLATDEIFRAALAGNAREGPMGRYDGAPTANAARMSQRVRRDEQAGHAARPLNRTSRPPFPLPFSGLRWELSLAIRIPHPGQLQCDWAMPVPSKAVIGHGRTMPRASHAGRVVHARICVRKTENCANYSAKILEENGDLWNQIQRYIAIY